jgi:hypothetical protein
VSQGSIQAALRPGGREMGKVKLSQKPCDDQRNLPLLQIRRVCICENRQTAGVQSSRSCPQQSGPCKSACSPFPRRGRKHDRVSPNPLTGKVSRRYDRESLRSPRRNHS